MINIRGRRFSWVWVFSKTSLYLNITPFFPSGRSYFVDLNSVNRVEYPTYKQPSREPVKKMIEFCMSASLHPYLFIRTSYSIFSLSKCGTVHESGSWACWLGSQSCCSCKGKDPNNPRNRDVIVTLADVRDDIRCQTKPTESVRLLDDCHSKIMIILVPKLERTSSTFLEDSICDCHVYMNMLCR